MNDLNEEPPEPSTLTLNRLLALGGVSVVMWAGIVYGAIRVWEIIV